MTVRELIERLRLKEDTAEVQLFNEVDTLFVPLIGIVESEDGKTVILCDKDTMDAFR